MKSNEVRELSPWLTQGCIVPLRPESPGGPPSFCMGWGNPTRSASPEPGQFSLYAPDFFLADSKPWRIYPRSSRISLAELESQLRDWSDRNPSLSGSFKWKAPDRKVFEEMFEDLRQKLASGMLKKAVPVVFTESPGTLAPQDRARLLRRGLEMSRNFALGLYGFWADREGMLGATPELLFRLGQNQELETMALAGTRPHHVPDRLPLLEDPKELEEHRFVIDGIASALAGWGGLRVRTTQELRLQKFSHLLTSISVQLDSARSFEDIARVLHPTPALGAWPREAGMHWLASLERIGSRRRFGAPFGALDESGHGICWVAIRGLQWTNEDDAGRILLGAGCGVTAQSELDREWNELLLKLESAKAALGV